MGVAPPIPTPLPHINNIQNGLPPRAFPQPLWIMDLCFSLLHCLCRETGLVRLLPSYPSVDAPIFITVGTSRYRLAILPLFTTYSARLCIALLTLLTIAAFVGSGANYSVGKQYLECHIDTRLQGKTSRELDKILCEAWRQGCSLSCGFAPILCTTIPFS